MSPSPPPRKVAVVIVGMSGSGKSTVASFLSAHDWPVVRFGDITMDEVKRRGLPVLEANERLVREQIRKEHGMGAFAKLSLPAIDQALSRAGKVAIDGLYSWSEYKELREHLKARLILLAVCTPRKERYLRLQRRAVRPLTPEEAESRDFAEIERLEKGGPIAFADHVLLNTETVEDLERSLREVLRAEGIAASGSSDKRSR